MFRQIKEYFNASENRSTKRRLSFVHLFGHEKEWGKPTPLDYDKLVAAYSSWAYACAWKNATSVAKSDLGIYKKTRDTRSENTELVRIYDHEFIKLINTANPFSNKFELLTITQIFMELTGNAYWWVPKNTFGVPASIWNLPANWMRIVPSETKFIEGYVMQVPGKGQLIPFEEDEVIHFKYPSPFSLFYGTGPTLAAKYGINLNEQMKTWGINFFLNNANPGGALVTESSLTPDQYQRLRDQWNRKHRGAKNAGKMAFLEGGLKFEKFGSNMRESSFKEIDRGARDEILAMFGVPASKLGLVEDVNRANADANDYSYQKETILPKLILIEEKLNEKLVPMYDERLVCKFDNPVPDDNDFRLREKETNIRSGITTIDEEREKEGLEPFNLPETSRPLVPFSVVPAGEERNSDPLNDPFNNQDNDEDKEEKAFKSSDRQRERKWRVFVIATEPQERLFTEVIRRYFQRQHRDVMRRLAQQKKISNVVNKDIYSFIAFSVNEENDRLKRSTVPYLREAYVTGLKLGMQDTSSVIDLNLFEPNILRTVNERAAFVAEKINESTQNALKDALTEGINLGESIEDISKRIDSIYQFNEKFRSKRIAQTEVIGATNDGQLKAYQEAGVTKKEWITARDEKVRESHKIDGQVQEINDTFRTNDGSHLLYPGDRSTGAPASDIINCRCTVNPVL